MKVCTFIGHRFIKVTQQLRDRLLSLLEFLIVENGVGQFLLGSASQFNSLCVEVLCQLKIKYPHIERIRVRAEYDYSNYKEIAIEWSKFYEDKYFPQCVRGAGKKSYVVRNQYIINKSDIVVFYYDEEYQPAEITRGKYNLSIRRASGTKLAYEYAVKKKKIIYNLFEK